MGKSILTIFGATGDLMAKKIVPALFSLYSQKKLGEDFEIIGFGRRDFEDYDFRIFVSQILKNHNIDLNSRTVENFLETISYFRGNFNEQNDFDRLKNLLDQKSDSCRNIFYIASSPEFYSLILENIQKSNLNPSESVSKCKLIIEKPLGWDLESAKNIENLIASLYTEDQVFRIDHYLAKEVLLNVLTFRFVNNIFRGSWTNKYIEKISVRILEKIDVSKRGSFYDSVGALRDVGQNHLLQMFAMATMEKPVDTSSDAIRESRANAVKNLKEINSSEINAKTQRAQYEGYQETEGVSLGSKTETYFKINTEICEGSLKGVQIELEAGKAMAENKKEIVVIFKDTDFSMEEIECKINPNEIEPDFTCRDKVIFSLEPDESIILELFYKLPGLENKIKKKIFRLPLSDDERKTTYSDYAKILFDAIAGNQTLFISHNEQLAAWEFINPILKAWECENANLEKYEKGALFKLK